jgi:hypothetical protein
MAVTAKDFDHPLVFIFAVTIGVVGMIGLGSWFFNSIGWGGPLSLLKGGVA